MGEYLTNIFTWANQNSGALLVVLTFLYCITTLAIVMVSRRSNRLSEHHLQQAIEMDVAARRPYCFLKPRITKREGLPYAYLFLQNTGKTPALNLCINLSPTPSTEAIFGDSKLQRVPYFLKFPIKSLAPGEELHDSIGFTPELYKRFDPPVFSGEIEYQDILGNSYKEPVSLDFKILERAVLDLRNEI